MNGKPGTARHDVSSPIQHVLRVSFCTLVSCCCLTWFVITCVFVGLFAWSYTRPLTVLKECVEIKLLSNTSTELAHGMFDRMGTECVYRSRLPAECRPYFADVHDCVTIGNECVNRSGSAEECQRAYTDVERRRLRHITQPDDHEFGQIRQNIRYFLIDPRKFESENGERLR